MAVNRFIYVQTRKFLTHNLNVTILYTSYYEIKDYTIIVYKKIMKIKLYLIKILFKIKLINF